MAMPPIATIGTAIASGMAHRVKRCPHASRPARYPRVSTVASPRPSMRQANGENQAPNSVVAEYPNRTSSAQTIAASHAIPLQSTEITANGTAAIR